MKKAILIQQQETGRPLLTIICYRLVPLDDHLQKTEGHEKLDPVGPTVYNEAVYILGQNRTL